MSLNKKHTPKQGGFVMVIVLLLLAVILSAGLFGVEMLRSDSRSHARFKRNLIVSRAASAGAAHRVAQIETSKNDPMSAIDVNIDWTSWPDPNTPGISDFDMANSTQYVSTAVPVMVNSKPPAGVQIGGAAPQTLIWQIRSYSIPNDVNFGGEHGVNMGVKIITSGSQSYNVD